MDEGALAASEPLQLAEQATRLAASDAVRARELAEVAIANAAAAGDGEAVAAAERALGLAAREQGELRRATHHLRRSIRVAARAGLREREADARVSLAYALFELGRARQAVATLSVDGVTSATASARLAMARALIHARSGDLAAALAGYQAAIPATRLGDDRVLEARAHMNRGLIRAYLGQLDAAAADIDAARAVAETHGLALDVAMCDHNLGFVAAQRGDAAAALALYARAEEGYATLDAPLDEVQLDRAHLLLSLNLVADARESAAAAVAALEARSAGASLAEARLALAYAAAATDGELAEREARRALAAFGRQERPAWAALARHAALVAAWQRGGASSQLLRAARATADALEDAGWRSAAADARLIAGRVALERAAHDVAARELDRAAATRRAGTVDVRVRGWHAEALRRQAGGDDRGALRAAAAGLRVVEDHRASLGATELRAHAFAHGEELAALGARLALRSGRAARVLEWTERWRAGALRLRSVRPSADERLAALLGELRAVASRLDEATREGTRAERRPLAARQAELERAVRDRARTLATAGTDPGASGFSLRELRAALGDRALVEYVGVDDRLLALVLVDGRAALRELDDAAQVRAELVSLRAALRRLADRRTTAAARAAWEASARHAAERLDALLLAPLPRAVAEREVVVVPTRELHALPWSDLPSRFGRATAVAPSAALWLRAGGAPRDAFADPDRVTLVAGPGLEHAPDEVRAIAAGYPGATVLTGAAATTAAVAAALGASRGAHVAAHGQFRTDNPLFSALLLRDGPLTAYDIEALPRVPRELVLSACDAGSSAVRPGDELMGLAAAFLGIGTSALVASVVPVADGEARTLMLALHAALRAGEAPARALARARAETGVGAGFVCIGAG
jgi:CHAT domain-containing protein